MKQLYTPWGETLDKNHVLEEYPRPQMVRDSYLNLNGYWEYAISDRDQCDSYCGKILVPFSPESVLSEVNQFVSPHDYLHYHTTVLLPQYFMKNRLLLHFGAVDQEVKLYINHQLAKEHLGGFTPFEVDITNFLSGDTIDIHLVVRDISDTSFRQTGKQRIHRGGIFYTAQSGIWQTVWLESVPKDYVRDVSIEIAYDESQVILHLDTDHDFILPSYIKVFFKNQLLLEKQFQSKDISFTLKDKLSWTPEVPNLYQYELSYGEDTISGYFGMRKFERKTDSNGIMRFYLNNRPYFLSGLLDQGYYPDGLLTPPSDEAMIFDIKTMKNLGFNLLRKHIKIEPLRWYYHCDRLGMIVWQDMVSGSARKDIMFHGALALLNIHLPDYWYSLFGRKSLEGRLQFQKELEETVHHLKNITSISTWVPFNEAWGQFDAKKTEQHLRILDNSRLVDHASGWSDQKVGDYYSRHIYFKKIKFPNKKAKKRILALTEFGGYSYMIDGHSFNPDQIFGYRKYPSKEQLESAILNLYELQIYPAINKGLGVLIYTQVSDVEDEVNGFLTYDRKILKINPQKINEINQRMYQIFNQINM